MRRWRTRADDRREHRELRASPDRPVERDVDGAAVQLAPALRWLLAAGLFALLVLKLAYIFRLDVNSDEPQHLHVVWAWTAGLLPYRDLFDNHAPLFQLLWSPLLALFGERADIVVLMRLTVLPLFFASLWLTWRIARTLWSLQIAIAAVAITAACVPFFVVSTQFRPDDLWAMLWLATICVLIGGPLDVQRGALAGLLAGATMAVSLKTAPLLLTAAFAALLLAWALRTAGRRPQLPWRFIVAFAASALLIPAVLVAFFAANGAAPAMVYALFRHNIVGDLGRWEHGDLRFLLAPLTLPFALWVAWHTRPRAGDLGLWARRCFVLLAASGYLVSIYAYWPLFTRQDLLPAVPFGAIALALLLLRAGARAHPLERLRRGAAVFVVLAEAVTLVSSHPFWEDRYGEFEQRLSKILSLTRPQDYVMDAKGDAIFRRRPIYWVLESITLARMRDGSIADDIATRLAATSTPLVVPERLPDADQPFIDANYLALGDDIRVAGRRLGAGTAGVPLRFDVAVPLDYALVTPAGSALATIDGQPCAAQCTLSAGAHALVPAQDGEFALIWAPALARGVDPAAFFAEAPRP